MSRSSEIINSLKEELRQVEASKESLDKRIQEIKNRLKNVEDLTTKSTNDTKDFLIFKD
jgi:prefoldin subunit 5